MGEGAQYGLRLLRSGYVYVFDEARKRWDEYFVTGDSFLTKMPPRTKGIKVQQQPATVFQCARNGVAPLAGVITVRNPKHATNIWIAFSDVEWTASTFEKHHDAAYRERHMQKIAINAGKVALQPQTAPLEQVENAVAEFKLDAATVKKYLAPWVPFLFHSRASQSSMLKQAAQSASPQGGAALVALLDSVALTAEIDAMMNWRFKAFSGDAKRQRPLAVSQTILQIEEAVRSQALDDEEDAAERIANDMLSQPDLGMLFEGYRKRKIERIEEIRTVTPQEAERAQDNAWKAYQLKFDEPAMKAWRKQNDVEMKAFDVHHIAPLAKAHHAWMTSAELINSFECNFDDMCIESGAAYVLTLSLCIGDTQDKAICFDLYSQWLNADTFEKSNLLLNAFALNSKQAKDEIKKSVNVSLDWRGFSWDGLVGAIAETFKGRNEKALEALGTQLVVRTMGPLAKVASDAAAT